MREMILFCLLLASGPAAALVTCEPASCTPGCDSTCVYRTCNLPESLSISIKNLPFPISPPPDACDFTAPNPLLKIPDSWISAGQNVSVKSINQTVVIPYYACRDNVASGPPCPPPAK